MGWLKKLGSKVKSTVKKATSFVKKNVGTVVSVAASVLPGGGIISKGVDLINAARMPDAAKAASQTVNQKVVEKKTTVVKEAAKTSTTAATTETKEKETDKKKSGALPLVVGTALSMLMF